MALTKRTNAPTPKFEEPAATPAAAPETAATQAAAAPTPEPTPQAAAAPTSVPVTTPGTAIAPVAPKALVIQQPQAVALMKQGHAILDGLRDAMRVDWNTLTRLKLNQGRISMEPNVNFGDWVDFELLSYQQNHLISPGSDTPEAKEFAKYSDDGVTVKDTGEDCKGYIARLKEMGYEKARMGKRVILVASLLDCDKDAEITDGMLFQIDLPPTSREAFERYTNQTAFDLAKGRTKADFVVYLRMKANIEKQKGSTNEYTVATFVQAPTAAQYAAAAIGG